MWRWSASQGDANLAHLSGDRPYKILLAQVGTLSFSHPLFGVSVSFIYLSLRFGLLIKASVPFFLSSPIARHVL